MRCCSSCGLRYSNVDIWKNYSGSEKTALLDYYFCDSTSAELPIRDVSKRRKLEPHYEDKTFNSCKSCNQRFLKEALKVGVSYIFFFTRYSGSLLRYRDKYYLTGYYKIGKIGTVKRDPNRKAVRASHCKFVSISDSLPLRKIIGKKIINARYMPKRLEPHIVDLIIRHFRSKPDKRREYVIQTVQIR